MPVSKRRRIIAARCRVTGEPKDLVARLVGRDKSHGLDDCTDAQRRFRALLTLFQLNATPNGSVCTGRVAAQGVWTAWTVVQRFLPYPNTLVVTTKDPEELVRALADTRGTSGHGVPGLRCVQPTTPSGPTLLHIPTGATLRVQGPGTPVLTGEDLQRDVEFDNSATIPVTSRENRLLGDLPSMTSDVERLLAALLVRLPLRDPDGIWAFSRRHIQLSRRHNSDPVARAAERHIDAFWNYEQSWHFRWSGPVSAFDIAAALTDTLIGLAGATAVLRPHHPAVIYYGPATLTLHHAL